MTSLSFGKRPSTATAKSERPRAVRSASPGAARILIGRKAVECTVIDISSTGALLRFENALGIPNTFELEVAGRKRTVRVVRRAATRVAVQFAAALRRGDFGALRPRISR
jgi:PilZ domain